MAVDAQIIRPRIDLSRYELTVGGHRLRLERQPMELLILFVQRKGQLVTRADIVQKLWGKDVFVDADASINRAVRKIRSALHDDSDKPRYLETVVGKGYRFVGDIEIVQATPPQADLPKPAIEVSPIPRATPRRWQIMSVWAVLLAVVAATLSWMYWRRPRAPRPGQIHSIAVLPLENLSGDPSQDYFADGMTDELITELAQIGSLRIISRTSAMRYRHTSKTLPEIASELRVDALLEGSVARSGSRVRITAQLIEVASDNHLWASGYEGETRDVLELQDAVARDVVKQIRLRLTAEQQARLTRSRIVDPEAHEAYLKGLYYWNKRDKAGLEKAIDYFNQAIAINPNYALPYAGLAQSYVPLTYLGYLRGIDVRPKVATALAKALELDGSLAEAHTAAGSAKHFYEYDWKAAETEFQRAIELNPSYATAHQWYAQMLGCEGRDEAALAEHNRAAELDPFSPIIGSGTGNRLYRLRRYDEAAASLREAIRLYPDFPSAHWNLGLVYLQQKKYPSAITELEEANTLFGGNSLVLGGLGYAYGASGDTAHANAILRRLEMQARSQYVDPYAFALVYAGAKNKNKAFEWLEKAVEDRDGWIGFIKGQPMLDDLRPDARYKQLLRQMNLAP